MEVVMAMKMGDYLVSVSVLTEKQVAEVIRIQKEGDTRKFGDIAVSQGFMEEDSIKRFNEYVAAN
jgi:hypothetical protein